MALCSLITLVRGLALRCFVLARGPLAQSGMWERDFMGINPDVRYKCFEAPHTYVFWPAAIVVVPFLMLSFRLSLCDNDIWVVSECRTSTWLPRMDALRIVCRVPLPS